MGKDIRAGQESATTTATDSMIPYWHTAPDLYEALKIAKENIEWWRDNHGCCAGAEIGAIGIIDAAIAKAEGK